MKAKTAAAGPRSVRLILIALMLLSIAAAFGVVGLSGPAGAAGGVSTKGLWVFGDSVSPHPVTTSLGRGRLASTSDLDGVNRLFVSVYRSTLSSAGRRMYEDADIADLITRAKANGQEVWAAYGAPEWVNFGCAGTDFPVQRMAEVAAYNAANPAAAFDGVMLDVEPNPVTAAHFQDLIDHYQCMRSSLPVSVKLGAAISAFWHTPVDYPAGGALKPAYAHIIDQNLDSVVVMGYRDTAGTDTCPSSDGMTCLDRDEIDYATSINKAGLVLAGHETLNPASAGLLDKETFFEEGQASLVAESQNVVNRFASSTGFGGVAIHNYGAAYLSGAPGWPAATAIGVCDSGNTIDVESSGGTMSAGYATLKLAFDAINAGTHTGTIAVEVCGNTNEGTVSAALNPGNVLPANYTSIIISPSGGVARMISGATTAGNPLINLNGADFVTIDGLNTGGNSLTISNTTVSTTSGTSTIRFVGDATNNVITNSNILGSASMAAGTNGGNIWFSTAASGGTGNDSNTISNNSIGPAGSNLPTKGIYSSGTTTAVGNYNSGIIISANNIFDYFGTIAQSAGIYVAGGSTDWTIQNNKLYQTATRTQTAGTIHAGIQLASANINNCTISGNTIGFSDGSGTGTYSFVGFSGSSRFYPIYLSAHGTLMATSIQGNTVSGISVSGPVSGTLDSGPFSGILILQGLANIGDVVGNTIGSTSNGGSVSVSSSSGTNSEIYGIFFDPAASPNISNNSIGGITVNNTSTGGIDFYGVRASTAASSINTVTNNTVGYAAAPILNNSTSSGSNLIGIYSDGGTSVLTGNIVSNMTMVAGNPTTGSGASIIGIRNNSTSAANSTNISQNTVRNLVNTDTGSNDTVTGIHYAGPSSGTNLVQRNLIHSLRVGDASSVTGTVNGINVEGGTATYQNNMIALGNGVTAGNQINGYNDLAATTSNFYHNSVYIGGAGVVGSSNSFALRNTGSSTRNYRNNILFNARSNGAGTGKHYTISVQGNAGLVSNNNVLFANGTGGFTGQFAGADQATLANWQAASSRDANSFSSDPQFVSPAGATPDLHINTGSPTVVEAGGADVGVGDDFDGQARAGLTPVDIGADAGNFTGVSTDTTPPTINYSTLANTTSTASRVLTATIADDTAVANGALLPRIYFRKNAGAYFSTQCVLQSGNQQSGTYDCTIDNSLMGGAAGGDTIGYYVIAQDTAGNIRSNPAGVVAANVNTVTTPPTPNTYSIQQTFGGTMSVGAGEALTSLTNNGGLFEALNAGIMTGDLTINITTDLTAETGTHSLNQLVESGAGGYTLFFQASGGARLIEGSNAVALINLNGADRVTFSGLAFGPGGLMFRNTGTGATIRLINDASSNSIVNCVVEGGTTSSSNGVVMIGPGSTNGNDSNSISDSTIRDRTDVSAVPLQLVYIEGTGLGTTSDIVIANNQFINFKLAAITSVGIENFTINGNAIFHTTTRTTALASIQVLLNMGSSVVSGNTIRDHTTNSEFIGLRIEGTTGSINVSANRIFNIDNTPGSTGALTGIQMDVSSGPSSNVTLINNMISITPGTASMQAVHGINDRRAGGSLTMNHNSVLIGGPGGGSSSWAYRRDTGSSSTVSLTNNIFFNGRTGGADNFAVSDLSGGSGSWSSDYNLFVGAGATAANFFEYNGTAVDFAAWKTGPPARDANSLASVNGVGSYNVGSMFTSANDLHLRTINNPAINSGTDAGVSTDFDGQARPFGSAPDIGADEVQTNPTAADASISGRVLTADGRGIKNIRVVVFSGDLSQPRFAITNAFGYFRLEGLGAGQTYVVSVSGKRYLFDPPARVVSLGEDAVNVDFVGEAR